MTFTTPSSWASHTTTPGTSWDRVACALSGREPDRVPYFLPLTMHGAQDLGVGLDEYYSSAALVARGQLRLQARYGSDFLYPFFYGALEFEAFGGEVEHFHDGPPHAVGPLDVGAGGIAGIVAPAVADSPVLGRVLDAIEILARSEGRQAPIAAVVMSAFSLPLLQLGFGRYLELLTEEPGVAARLLEVNEQFTAAWARAQRAAGADLIVYFDPLASPAMLPLGMVRQRALPALRRTLAAVGAPSIVLLASGACQPILAEVAPIADVVGVSHDEDLGAVKAAAAGRITVMGNLNSLEMRHWSSDQARDRVRHAIGQAATGGGFILSDSLGEIPLEVGSDVLDGMRAAVSEHGTYPLEEVAS
jgi:uroporphyrinogen decarboxylase